MISKLTWKTVEGKKLSWLISIVINGMWRRRKPTNKQKKAKNIALINYSIWIFKRLKFSRSSSQRCERHQFLKASLSSFEACSSYHVYPLDYVTSNSIILLFFHLSPWWVCCFFVYIHWLLCFHLCKRGDGGCPSYTIEKENTFPKWNAKMATLLC